MHFRKVFRITASILKTCTVKEAIQNHLLSMSQYWMVSVWRFSFRVLKLQVDGHTEGMHLTQNPVVSAGKVTCT